MKNKKHTRILFLLVAANVLASSADAGKQVKAFHQDDTYGLLYNAVESSNAKALEHLLEQGVDPNTQAKHGNTPLIQAAEQGNTESILTLLKHGADPASRDEQGQTFIALVLETAPPATELISILSLPHIQSFIKTLSAEERTEYLQMLTTRAFADASIGPLIIWFEEQFGLDQSDTSSVKDAHLDPWKLKKFWEAQDIESVHAHMREKTWIGIVTDQGVSYDSIIKATRIYQEAHPETQFAYVTRKMADTIGLKHFSGLIFPGGDDNYPEHLETFTLEDMPEHEQTEKERVYQYLYKLALARDIPTLGICAGAQHLVLHRGGTLTHNKTHAKKVRFTPHHVPHFLTLTPQERQTLLETCEDHDSPIKVFRAHKYSAVTETVRANNLTLAMEDDVTPLAFYEGFQTLAIQFHPEARYKGVNRYGDAHSVARQTALLNGFFSLCENYKAWIDWAEREGRTRDEAMTLRETQLQKILERLEECRENPDAEPIIWNDSVTFDINAYSLDKNRLP